MQTAIGPRLGGKEGGFRRLRLSSVHLSPERDNATGRLRDPLKPRFRQRHVSSSHSLVQHDMCLQTQFCCHGNLSIYAISETPKAQRAKATLECASKLYPGVQNTSDLRILLPTVHLVYANHRRVPSLAPSLYQSSGHLIFLLQPCPCFRPAVPR